MRNFFSHVRRMYYSYLWLREDGTPYYVGKGFGNRAYKMTKNHQPPVESFRILIFPMANETEAHESERALINLFGRQDLGTGLLVNKTAGGQGIAGYVFLPETRRKIAAATSRTQKGRKHSPEHIAKIAAANRGKHHDTSQLIEWHKTHAQSSEWKAKVEAAKIGRTYSSDAIAHMSAAQKLRFQNKPAAFAGKTHTLESIVKQSAARRLYWQRRKNNVA